jgi:hypothetical protein
MRPPFNRPLRDQKPRTRIRRGELVRPNMGTTSGFTHGFPRPPVVEPARHSGRFPSRWSRPWGGTKSQRVDLRPGSAHRGQQAACGGGGVGAVLAGAVDARLRSRSPSWVTCWVFSVACSTLSAMFWFPASAADALDGGVTRLPRLGDSPAFGTQDASFVRHSSNQ